MKAHQEIMTLADGRIELLRIALREPGAPENKKHELRVRIEELEKSKLRLATDSHECSRAAQELEVTLHAFPVPMEATK